MEMIISREKITTRSNKHAGAIVVSTALDAIARLERATIARVVLAGSFAADPVLAAFISEAYPTVHLELEA
jgi:hypothetical protein